MLTIIFESHGTTFDNEKGIASGNADAALSPLGEEQARQLGKRRGSERIDEVFCSDLQRSYRTGDIAFAGRDAKIIRDARLREADYGDLTGETADRIKREAGEHIKVPWPNGESYEQTSERMKSFLQDLLRDYDDKRVMIIGSRATQYGLEHWIKGVPLEQAVTAPWRWQPGWEYQLNKI